MNVVRPKLVLISGLSGSGKSTVAKCFEDLGYYCVDNLPLPLLKELLSDPLGLVGEERNIAVVTDVRAPGFASEMPRLLTGLRRDRFDLVLLFLEASDEALMRRFSETRRTHPMTSAEWPLAQALRREREVLAELRGLADMVFDTSEWSIHEIRNKVNHAFPPATGKAPGMVVSLTSFGFKFGIPSGTDLLFDVRFLANPHFVPDLRERTGCDVEVQSFLEAEDEYRELRERLAQLLLYLLPRYRRENRSYLSVAIGCTGGKHRSVTLAEQLRKLLGDAGWTVRLEHRDLER